MQRTQTAIRTTIVSIVVNAVLAAVKIVVGIVGHSFALIADGIESLNDLIASGVVLLSLRVSAIPPDEEHPYGHGKAEQLGALFSALSLLGAGGVIVFQSTRNLIDRHTSPSWFTLPVLVLVIVVKELLSRYALKKSVETTSAALKGDAWHHRSDAITSAAAFIGLSIALIGGKGYESADDWAALLACVVILFNGYRIFRAALNEIMDAAAPDPLQKEIRALSSSVPGVVRIEKCRTRKSGLGLFVDIHVEVDGDLTVRRGHEIAHQVSDHLKASSLSVQDVVVHVEPALRVLRKGS